MKKKENEDKEYCLCDECSITVYSGVSYVKDYTDLDKKVIDQFITFKNYNHDK